MHIRHACDFRPKRQKAYRVPDALKPEIARQLQELLDMGFIRPSDSNMASPIVCVLKLEMKTEGYGYVLITDISTNTPVVMHTQLHFWMTLFTEWVKTSS